MSANDIVAAALLAVACAGLVLYVRISRADRAHRDKVEQRARAALTPSGSAAFDSGALGALDGFEAWSNPHCTPSSLPKDAAAWAAGWCYGRQLLRDAWRAED